MNRKGIDRLSCSTHTEEEHLYFFLKKEPVHGPITAGVKKRVQKMMESHEPGDFPINRTNKILVPQRNTTGIILIGVNQKGMNISSTLLVKQKTRTKEIEISIDKFRQKSIPGFFEVFIVSVDHPPFPKVKNLLQKKFNIDIKFIPCSLENGSFEIMVDTQQRRILKRIFDSHKGYFREDLIFDSNQMEESTASIVQ